MIRGLSEQKASGVRSAKKFTPRFDAHGPIASDAVGVFQHPWAFPRHFRRAPSLTGGLPQRGEREQRPEPGRVLGQPPVANLHRPELALAFPKRMLHPRPHAGLKRLALALAHGYLPSHFAPGITAFICARNSRLRVRIGLRCRSGSVCCTVQRVVFAAALREQRYPGSCRTSPVDYNRYPATISL